MKQTSKFFTLAFAAAIVFCAVSCQKEAVETAATTQTQATAQNTTAKVVYLEDKLLDLSKKEDAESFATFLKSEPNKGSIVEVKSGEKTTLSQASVRWFKNKETFHKYALKNKTMTQAEVNKEVEMAKNPSAFKTAEGNSLETRSGWQNFTARFYYHCNYGGNYLQFGSSNGFLPAYTSYVGNYWNDQISSMVLDNWNNNKGVYVTLYEHANYVGYWTRVYLYPYSYLSDSCFVDGIDYKGAYGSTWINGNSYQNWNDRVSSIYINNF
jgi:hypothetical protein